MVGFGSNFKICDECISNKHQRRKRSRVAHHFKPLGRHVVIMGDTLKQTLKLRNIHYIVSEVFVGPEFTKKIHRVFFACYMHVTGVIRLQVQGIRWISDRFNPASNSGESNSREKSGPNLYRHLMTRHFKGWWNIFSIFCQHAEHELFNHSLGKNVSIQ